MLHDVGDEHILTAEAVLPKHLGEELSGCAHERATLQILILARCLTDQQDFGIRIALTGHRLARALVKDARPACPDFTGDPL